MIEYGTTSRAVRRGRRDTAPPREPEPARDDAQADHARGPPGVAHDRRPAAPLRLLHRERRRLRRDRHPAPTARATSPSARLDHGRSARQRHARTWASCSETILAVARVGAHGCRRVPPAPASAPTDIDAVMIYDHFTPFVIISLEAYGFCEPGEGGAVRRGRAHRAATANCPSTPMAATTPRRTSTACRTSSRPSASCAAPPPRRSRAARSSSRAARSLSCPPPSFSRKD